MAWSDEIDTAIKATETTKGFLKEFVTKAGWTDAEKKELWQMQIDLIAGEKRLLEIRESFFLGVPGPWAWTDMWDAPEETRKQLDLLKKVQTRMTQMDITRAKRLGQDPLLPTLLQRSKPWTWWQWAIAAGLASVGVWAWVKTRKRR